MEKIYIPKQNYKVLVHTITYNQAKYITDTLDGVAMQQTNFPFVHYVIDDCSTDGEQEVIESWLNEHCEMDKAEYIDLELANVILVPHKTNTNLTFAIYLLKRNLWKEPKLKGPLVKPWRDHCEYEALCEGDDYWTHPEKLQRQTSIMDDNPDLEICFNRVQTIHASDGTKSFIIPKLDCSFEEGKVGLDDLVREEFKIGKWCFHTSSFFFRTKYSAEYATFKDDVLPSFPYGDMPMQMFYLSKGGYFLSETMGCYRLFSGGWNSTMRSNRELRIRKEQEVIAGLREFDKWTDYRYHDDIELQILRKEFDIYHDSFTFKFKYRKLMYPYLKNPRIFLALFVNRYVSWLYKLIKKHKS